MRKAGKFDGVLFCTDLDGTILRNDKTISKENLEAISYFKSEGGSFTFITGRLPSYSMDICNTIKPNVPFGCINGGGLYDHVTGKYIWSMNAGEGVMDLIRCIDEQLPNVGFQVSTFNATYFCKENKALRRFREAAKLPNLVCHYADIQEPVAKVIFASDIEEEIAEMKQKLASHPLGQNFSYIRSEKTLYEILPLGSSKGLLIEKLSQYLGIDPNKTIAIGDYNNDISMFRAAKVGVAVANACPDALAAADYITVSNEEHAIAQVIADLESGRICLDT